MNKYTMEVTKDKAVITLDIDGKTYAETWIKKGRGHWQATGERIRSQLEDSAESYSEEFFDTLESEDPTDIMQVLLEWEDQ